MKKLFCFTLFFCIVLIFASCAPEQAQVAATTLPVYDFATQLCNGTDIGVTRLITESVSCLHDYTLQVDQMRSIESAEVVIISGAGLEEFLDEALDGSGRVIDASAGIELICGGHAHTHEEAHGHGHDGHSHENDPHIWLSPENAKIMAQNICAGLIRQFPEHETVFQNNLSTLLDELEALQSYGEAELSELQTRELVTFHDGFAYLAQEYDLTILEAVEEESGSEAAASELIALIEIVEHHSLPAIFTETNGSTSAAGIIAAETEAKVFALDMAMAGGSYLDAMYHNIDTLKEALG